ncbi:MAG: hypothetical protein HY901_14210 [Deltaproteobacteria bacterium]|nr:hypothetical protein [Deltaproteobacteria bacterium]
MKTCTVRKTLAILLALASLSGLGACIQRPPSPREKRESFDRSGLNDILLKSPPSLPRRVGAVYGNAVELMGMEHSPQLPKAGDSVDVTFYYRVLDEADEDWKIFVHVDDPGGRGDRINADHWPANGRYNSRVWRKGEIVKDVWTFKVPGYYQGEGLNLWTGFYQPGKDDRWPLVNKSEVQNDGQNRVLAGTVPVGR